jgi:death on curing protein
MAEPTWVDLSVVLAIHDEQLAEHGGAPGLRDLHLLESAIARPRNLYAYKSASLAALAANYAYGIAMNHPFLDGNKRTSFVVAELFLALNGMDLDVDDDGVVITWLKLASGQISQTELASWIAKRCRTP